MEGILIPFDNKRIGEVMMGDKRLKA
jgi:hypothetical protein